MTLTYALKDSQVMIARNVRRSLRDPEAFFTALMLPIILMLLFVYVFGGAMKTSSKYVDYVVPGLIDKHCIMCHSAAPSHAGIAAPPAGLDFTKDDVVMKNVRRILFQVVTTQAMPLGNETHMTAAERATLSAWIAQGTKP